jgi:hypothetical protein
MTRPGCPLLVLLVCLAFAAACSTEESGFARAFLDPPPRPANTAATETPATRDRPTWTVLVYGHGDHDLSSTLLSDLAEMADARVADEVNLIVFADWDASRTIAGGQSRFPEGSFWYRVRGQGHELQRLRQGAELDFDDPAVLARAVGQAFREFPADRHGLILWDHGGAWQVGFGGDSQDGKRREAAGLPTQQVAAAVRAGLEQAGLLQERPLAFLAFDACLMGGAESITAFEELAEVFVGNAELDYGDGWDYQATFSWLSENPAADPRELAAFEVHAWDAHHRQASLNDALLRSHVAIDTAPWSRFVTATRQLMQAFRRSPDPQGAALALQRSLPAYKSQIATPRGSNLRDLGDVLRAFASLDDAGLASAAASALAAGMRARIGASAGAFREGQLGVHVFAGPPRGLAPAEVAAYPRLAGAWAGGSGWIDLIEQLRDLADADPPVLRGLPAATAGPTASFDVVSSDSARVDVALLRPNGAADAASAVVQGTLASAFVRSGRYDFSWNGELWTIASDRAEAPLTVEPWIWQLRDGELQAPILASPGLLRSSSGEELECVLLIDAESLEASAVALVSSGRPAVFDLQSIRDADPQTEFFPIQSVADLQGGPPRALRSTVGVGIPPGGHLVVRRQTAAPGPYLLQVRAHDVWGNARDTLFPVTAR